MGCIGITAFAGAAMAIAESGKDGYGDSEGLTPTGTPRANASPRANAPRQRRPGRSRKSVKRLCTARPARSEDQVPFFASIGRRLKDIFNPFSPLPEIKSLVSGSLPQWPVPGRLSHCQELFAVGEVVLQQARFNKAKGESRVILSLRQEHVKSGPHATAGRHAA